jgi:hypothetical protein
MSVSTPSAAYSRKHQVPALLGDPDEFNDLKGATNVVCYFRTA